MERLKVFFYNHKSLIYNLQYMAISFIVLILVMLIDLRIINIESYLPVLVTMKVSTAQSILTTLAGSLLTISTFTFSTILVVLNMYASNYTPRVVENFIGMKITMKVLGIYLGGFFYCVSALFIMQDFFENQRVIAGSVAIIYSLVCVFYFVRFVQSVISKFQGVNLISAVSNKAKEVIEYEISLREESDLITDNKEGIKIEIKSNDSGYLGVIDNKRIINKLKNIKGDIHIEKKIGEFITENTRLATVYSTDPKLKDLDEEDLEDIESSFILQDNKIADSDYRYNIIKLVEIALRALSPGINDPNTAIHCINKIGDLLCPLARLDKFTIKKESSDNFNIFYTSYKFEEDLFDTFLPLIDYGKEDLRVIGAVVNSLEVIKYIASRNNEEKVEELIKHIEEKVTPYLETDLEKELFEKKLNGIK